MSILKSLIKGSAWLTLANVISKLASAVALPLLARLLGPGALGIYSVVFQLAQSGQTVSGLGVPIAMQRNGAQYKTIGTEAVGRLFGVGLTLVCLVSASIGLGIFGLRYPLAQHWLGQPEVATWLGFAALVILLEPLGRIPLLFLASLQDFRSYALRSSLGMVVTSTATVFLAWQLGLRGALFGLVFGAIAQIFWSYLIVKPALRLRGIRLRFDGFWQESRSILKFGFPFYLGKTLLGTIVGLPLMGLVSHYGGLEQLGYLRVAQSMASLIGFIPTAIAPVALSYLSASSTGDNQSHQHLKSVHFRGVWILLLIPTSAVCLILPHIINWLYGNAYQQATVLAWLYLWISVLSGITLMLVQYLVVDGKTVRVALSSVVGVICWVLSAFLLVPQYSGFGFLLAQAVGQVAGYLIIFKPAMNSYSPADKLLIRNLLFLTFFLFSCTLVFSLSKLNSTLNYLLAVATFFLVCILFFDKILFPSEQIKIKNLLKR